MTCFYCVNKLAAVIYQLQMMMNVQMEVMNVMLMQIVSTIPEVMIVVVGRVMPAMEKLVQVLLY